MITVVGIESIRKSPSGEVMEVLTPAKGGDPRKFLNEQNQYEIPQYGLETIPFGMANQDALNNNDVVAAGAFVKANIVVSQLTCWITELGNAGTIRMAVYGLDGIRLALSEELSTDPDLGLVTLPVVGDPLVLSAPSAVYLALRTTRGGAEFLRTNGRFAGQGPAIGWEAPNSDLDEDLSAFLNTKRAFRYWVAAT